MRLYLAVALLVLALVACSEAQEQSFEDKLSRIGEQVTEFGRNVAEKAKSTLQDINNSPFVVNARNWFQEQVNKLKEKTRDMGQ